MDPSGNAGPYNPPGMNPPGLLGSGHRDKDLEHQAHHYSMWKRICSYILGTLLTLFTLFSTIAAIYLLIHYAKVQHALKEIYGTTWSGHGQYNRRAAIVNDPVALEKAPMREFLRAQSASSQNSYAVSQAPRSLRGPTVPFNFPDPAILSYGGTGYAFGTNTPSSDGMLHVQVATSADNLTWSLHSAWDALPNPGPWALAPGIWAPDVVGVSETTFVMYYSAPSKQREGTHCIGAAVSPPYTPLGPYYPLPEPIACPMDEGGAIDADGFLDPSNGKRYVIYKVDGNNIGHGGSCRNTVPPLVSTPIRLQEVSPADGVTPIGGPITILDRIDEDGPLIEAPSLYRTSWGVYFLFFSSGCFTADTYDVKYATATDIKGPWTRAASPLLSSGVLVGEGAAAVGLVGPGGMDVLAPSASQPAQTRPISGRNHGSRRDVHYEEASALFHGILSDAQLPDGYDFAASAIVGTGLNIGGWRESTARSVEAMRSEVVPSSKQSFLTTNSAKSGRLSARDSAMPTRPPGVVRGLYQGTIRFEGTNAFFV